MMKNLLDNLPFLGIKAGLIRLGKMLQPLWLGPSYWRGYKYASSWKRNPATEKNNVTGASTEPGDNPLWQYFTNHNEGRGIWKWNHYFPIYHRHFSKFIGKPVKILEIGIYSGGSLDMWRSYFGSGLVSALNLMGHPNASAFQADVNSIHFYPFAMVIEKNQSPQSSFAAPQRGTLWEPFFDR
jgi:hypothetical protein